MKTNFKIRDEVRIVDNGHLLPHEKSLVGDIGFVNYKDERFSEVYFFIDNSTIVLANEKLTLFESPSLSESIKNLFAFGKSFIPYPTPQ